MKILCAFGEFNYGLRERGNSYEYINFLPALSNLGHEVVFNEIWDKSQYQNYADLNENFLQTIELEKPDIVFCVMMGYEIWLETFDIARACSSALFLHWSTDDSWKYDQATKFIAPYFDLCATTYASAISKAKKDGFEHFVLTQWAANSATMIAPLPASFCNYQVSFVGSAYGNRVKWMDELNKHGIKVNCFGYGWPSGPISAEDIPRIIRESVISLNFGDSGLVLKAGLPVRTRQIKARVFEVPGMGGFLMTESAECLDIFYKINNEIVIFNDIKDLAFKIKHDLHDTDCRDFIAKSSFSRTQKEHTYEMRFEWIFNELLDRKVEHSKQECTMDMKQFATLARMHRTGVLLNSLKLLIELPCILFFGKKRGPRAARRFLYELSWRLFGKKTYSVKGWPGRLFYENS
jgi:spore maturation protein CgeB